MKDELEPDYPALYKVSDSFSLQAQKSYLFWTRVQLGSMLTASLLGVLKPKVPPEYLQAVNWGVIVALLSAIGTLWFLKWTKLERRWFDGRAVAESVKTMTWRYMMKVVPFNSGSDEIDRASFIHDLGQIRRARSNIAANLTNTLGSQALEISPAMDKFRGISLAEKKDAYINHRLADQRTWYEKKAQQNQKMSNLWAGFIIVVHFAAILFAISQLRSTLPINSVSVLMALAATFIAWTQVKRYDELVPAYNLAAQELREIHTLLQGCPEEESKFSGIIQNTEESISREHTMWCARRNTTT